MPLPISVFTASCQFSIARLDAADRAVDTAFEFQANLRQLRGFAGAGLATDNHHLVRSDGCLDLRTPIGYWQGIAEARLWETLVAMLGFVFGETNLLSEFLNCDLTLMLMFSLLQLSLVLIPRCKQWGCLF